MANFLFENNSDEEKCIEVIKCPNPSDCNNEIGDGRFDTFNIPHDKSHQINTKCNEICWRHCGVEKYNREKSKIIQV